VSRDEISEVGETPDEESSGKGGIHADVIVGKLKSRPSRRRDNIERTLSSDET
jgi:hypothetical protein